ncbi:hypothetical protein QR680_010230 [Steinernema hermaphroditum]|uniref:Uncharacterized protein n=1 Tax=Steinernema hermaphroditum TaxID=289476 RepID=A0AA39IN91_9BILA|nr:hypothetical protein QR680_010230 [Steinernema hermaphroditum]
MNSNLGVGIIDVAIFSLFFPLNARLLWILIRNKNFSQLWAYKLIFELAVIDALLLASTLIAGLMCLTESNFDPIFSRIAIHVHTAGHEMEGLLSVVLAFNRLVVMLNLKRFNKSWIYWVRTS